MQRAQAQRELLEEREALSRALLEMELARGEQEALAEALGKVGTQTRPTAGSGMDIGASPWVQVHPHGCIPRSTSPAVGAAPCPSCPHVLAPQVSPTYPRCPQVPPRCPPMPQVLPKPQSLPSHCALVPSANW